jgi:hypothetical protein
MSSYPVSISLCNHLRVNGTQCGSPALRGGRFCFFHNNWHARRIQLNRFPDKNDAVFNLPVLEDANSIQLALMEVMRLILSHAIDSKSAGLPLYALQTASLNLRRTDLEPATRERVVIDPTSVHETPLGEYLWAAEDFEDEDDTDTEHEQEIDEDEEETREATDDEEDEDEEDEELDDGEEDDEDNDDEAEDEEEDGPPLYVNRPVHDRNVNTNHARPSLAAAPAKAMPATASLAAAPAEGRQSADNSHSETPVAPDVLRKRVREQILAEAPEIAEAVGFDFRPSSPRPK